MIIAFTGKKQTGKSTACAYLERENVFKRLNFKDALIFELKQNFPELLLVLAEKYEMTVDELFNIKPPEVRTLMQNYGTNVRRVDVPNYWVDKWIFSQSLISNPNVTVDDLRFINEAEAVRFAGGIIVRIVRTDMNHTDTHVSETEMDSIVPDYTIVCNGGDEEHLYKELDKILKI